VSTSVLACFHLRILTSHLILFISFFFFSSRRRHTRFSRDWSSDVCSSDLSRRCPQTSVPQIGRKSDSHSTAQQKGSRGTLRRQEIGRASCREKCRSRWSPYH